MSDENKVEEGHPGEATAPTDVAVDDPTAEYVVEFDGEEEATASEEPGTNPGSNEDGQETNESGNDGGTQNTPTEPDSGVGGQQSSQSRHKTGDERFADLTRERYEAESRATIAETKYQEVLEELKALKNQTPGTANSATGEPQLLARPKMPTRESVDFDDDAYAAAMDKYQEDLDAYQDQQFDLRYQKREEARLSQVAQNQQAELAQQTENAFQKRQQEFMTAKGADGQLKYPDYQQTVFTDDVKITSVVAAAIKESENGPELLYQIAKSPTLMNKLLTVSPTQALVELGKLSVQNKAASSTNQVTNAPDPIDPLNDPGGSNLYQTLETMDIGDFMAQEEKKYYGETI